jgi:hypothetical protein
MDPSVNTKWSVAYEQRFNSFSSFPLILTREKKVSVLPRGPISRGIVRVESDTGIRTAHRTVSG